MLNHRRRYAVKFIGQLLGNAPYVEEPRLGDLPPAAAPPGPGPRVDATERLDAYFPVQRLAVLCRADERTKPPPFTGDVAGVGDAVDEERLRTFCAARSIAIVILRDWEISGTVDADREMLARKLTGLGLLGK